MTMLPAPLVLASCIASFVIFIFLLVLLLVYSITLSSPLALRQFLSVPDDLYPIQPREPCGPLISFRNRSYQYILSRETNIDHDDSY